MRVRFVLPNEDGGAPIFDKYIEGAPIPLPGETVGITSPDPHIPEDTQWLIWCEHRRWFIGQDEPVVEVWLTQNPDLGGALYEQGRCRVAFEQQMARTIPTYG